VEQPPRIRFELRAGAVTAIPLAVAVGLFGVSFGVLSATSGGMGALPAVVMSVTTFAGSAQFAAASIPMAIKAAGPVLLGGRPLPSRLTGVVALLAPALLAALVATTALGDGQEIVADARLIGLAAAVVALLLRAPVLLVVLVAAAAAGIARFIGIG
jgi:branched-subunit amino acid transport protein